MTDSNGQDLGKKPVGRPSKYTEEIGKALCDAIGTSKQGLEHVCNGNEEFPDARTVYRWLATNQEFRQHYAHAKELQAELIADEMLDIADDGSNDYMTITKGEETYNVEDREVTNRSRLRIDTRKWLLSKLLPKKYGDKLAVEHDVSSELADKMLEAQKRLDAND